MHNNTSLRHAGIILVTTYLPSHSSYNQATGGAGGNETSVFPQTKVSIHQSLHASTCKYIYTLDTITDYDYSLHTARQHGNTIPVPATPSHLLHIHMYNITILLHTTPYYSVSHTYQKKHVSPSVPRLRLICTLIHISTDTPIDVIMVDMLHTIIIIISPKSLRHSPASGRWWILDSDRAVCCRPG